MNKIRSWIKNNKQKAAFSCIYLAILNSIVIQLSWILGILIIVTEASIALILMSVVNQEIKEQTAKLEEDEFFHVLSEPVDNKDELP